ncbi:hypothetical protein HY086_00605 [Candidatus Gottesmanbacteria bacterium]|nr:hypothetical protein [Candidatus Gottesmanbacteria bacterium]
MADSLLVGALTFGRTFVGIIFRPYETYRRIIYAGTLWELPYIAVLLAFYFALASLVKTAAFRPFLLTRQFIVLTSATGATFFLVVGLLWFVGIFVGGKGQLYKLGLAWAYTLIPTVLWFLVTSLLYVVLPPPRTDRLQGILFSLLYLVFSVTLFFWKGILAYLTMRFGLKLDLKQVLIVSAISVPILGLYSVLMYRLGIFKVPFL